MDLKEACERLNNLAFQRENNAVVALNLLDCRAIRAITQYVKYMEQERTVDNG